jgi:hypothetical protein
MEMSASDPIRAKVEQLVSAALETQAANLRRQLTDDIVREISARQQSGHVPESGSATGRLRGAIASIQGAGTQTEILRALLEGTTGFSERAGLLVVRFNSAQGWQSRGFADEQAFRGLVIDCNHGLSHRVLISHEAAMGTVSDLDASFGDRFGAPHDGNVTLVPLVIKGKVAALLYADAGAEGSLDADAVEMLVQSAGMWLEIQTLRRAAGIQDPVHHAPEVPAVAAVAPVVEEAPVVEQATAPAEQTPLAESAPANGNGAHADDEVHKKARRFAKLLVDEIKLYNQSKVAEGRQARDLYSRLKDDIDKSRATYQRRYGHVDDVDYFRQELVRVLADNDVALLGASFS